MADISLFQAPNGDKFNIKDTTARTAAQQAQSTADSKISSSLKGATNGVAELDANGKVPALQLPSYVDDVLEYASKSAFPSTGETGKIYVDLATNLTYRWSGSAYVEISPSLALGETSSTAYRGDRGKTAYDHATESGKVSSATAVGLYKIGSTAQGHISGLTAVTKSDITALGIRALDNNTFDTISVTDLTAGDVVVTGVGRFTNGLYGNLTGNADTATKATQDGSGNTITSTYLPLSGGTMTGQLILSSSGYKTNSLSGYTVDQHGNFKHQQDTNTHHWIMYNNAGVEKFSVYWETGNVIAAGNVTAPKFIGALQGNADTATNVAWSGVTGKPSTYTPASGSTYYVQNHTGASWATSTSGSWVSMVNSNSTGNPTLPTSGKWWQVLSLDCWNSAPNNWVSQLALPTSDSKTNVWYRTNPSTGTSIESGTWIKILDEKNYNDYAPTKTGTGASGTWAISVTGNAATATKATQDGSGNTITSTYLPLAGGTMTGQIVLASSALKTNESAGWTMNQYGNLVHQRATTTDYWAIANNTGTYKFQVYYETGAVTAAGNITAPKFIGALQGNADTATSATTASKLGSSNVGSATQPIYLSAGTATACTYTLGKSVPSDAVFTDTKNTAGSTDTSSKIYLIGATSQAANPQTYSDDQVYVTSGTLQANSISATTNVIGVTLGVNSSTGTTGGISLYGGAGNVDNYGIAFRSTSNKGVHGYVQGNWATYFTMDAQSNRGWVFKNSGGTGNVASISNNGNAVFNGSVTVGGNAANTSGVRQVYSSTTKSLDFVFVA